jgi:hypothetical protein
VSSHFLPQADGSVAGFSAKDADRGFVVQCGEAPKVWFLAENSDARRTWVEGLILACNFEGKMTPTLMQEIMDLFIVETELVRRVLMCVASLL